MYRPIALKSRVLFYCVVCRHSYETFDGRSLFYPYLPCIGWCRISIYCRAGKNQISCLGFNPRPTYWTKKGLFTQISDSFKKSLTEAASAEPKSYYSPYDFYNGPIVLDESSSSNNCSGSSFIDPETVDIDFRALQYSLFITTIIAALSAYFFFLNAWY